MLEMMYYVLFFLEMFVFIITCFFMFVDESSTKPAKMGNREHVGNFRMSIPLIGVNLIMIVLSAYGGYRIDYFVMNTTSPVTYSLLSTHISDFNIWAVVFFAFFLINILLLFASIFYYLREATFDEKAVHMR